ncbi:universal stress protein [Amphritea sp. 1_MG-2023]|uniref:universal stress protein n=1 Tax=Amphritea sp. 1_MG-2023 TaxID=3062670 RepID=UPI0026E33F97|nr:universal stress protein [Amphritea sp. 1_MG-2023]MDO6564162.1 universal stress protein [Amphritea sp. 1_MG-2023]
MDISKILVNIEQGADAELLLEKALRLAEGSGAKVELFCCCYNAALRQSYLFDQASLSKAEQAYQRHVEAELEPLTLPFKQLNIDIDMDVCWQRHPAEAVVRKALRFAPDIVLHQIKQHSRLGHYLFDQSDWQLIRECPVPLLLVKQKVWSDGGHVAAAVDPLHECDRAAALDHRILAWARRMVHALEGDLKVMHSYSVLPHSVIFDEHLVLDFEQMQHTVRTMHIEALSKLLKPYGLTTDNPAVTVKEKEAHRAILEYVDEAHIDILVVGGVTRGLIDRILVGSTIERILDELQADLMVVKPPGFVSSIEEN